MDITEARKKLEDLRTREKELLAAAAYVHTAISSLDRLIQAADKVNASGVKSADLDAMVKETTSLLLGIATAPPKSEPAKDVLPSGKRTGRKAVEVSPPPSPTPALPNGKKVRKTRSFGCWPTSMTILKRSFAPGTPPPASLEEALERTYGQDWQQETFDTLVKPGAGSIKISFANDLTRGVRSQVRRCLGQTMSRLYAIKIGNVPGGKKVMGSLAKTFQDIDVPKNWETIVSTVRQWGIEVNLDNAA